MIAINKHSSKLKNLSVEMPNAPYSNRCTPLITIQYSIKYFFCEKGKMNEN
jgi:hypothetical protein